MSKNIVVIGRCEVDKVKSMSRKELNAECLHLMREQMELTQDLHDAKAEIAHLREIEEAAREYREYGTQQVPPVHDCGESLLTRHARLRLDKLLGGVRRNEHTRSDDRA